VPVASSPLPRLIQVFRFVPELKEALVDYRKAAATKPAAERTPESAVDVALSELFTRLDSSPTAVDPTP